MELILLRHGKAEDYNLLGDTERQLMPKGHWQGVRAAKLLEQATLLPEVVLTSPLVRARQTAEAFCAAAGMPGPIVQGWLACGMAPEQGLRELAAFMDFSSVAIVGHEPDFSMFAEWILGFSCGNLEVKKAALVGITIEPPARTGTLRFLIPPKLIGLADIEH